MFSFRYARWIIVSSVIPTLLAAQKTAVKPVIAAASLKERHAFEILLNTVEESVVSAAEAMPADKYGFAPRDGEFTGVRTFSRQVKHLATTNHILAAAALGQDPPADAGDEMGPDALVTKPDIINYLKSGATFNSVQGPVKFDNLGENTAEKTLTFQWQNGNLVQTIPTTTSGSTAPQYPKPAWAQ